MGKSWNDDSFFIQYLSREVTPYRERSKYLIRDNDNKFGTLFDRVAKGTGTKVLKIP